MTLQDLSLLDFIPALSPDKQPPYHLSEWCSMIEGCLKGGVRGLCAVPIRHHKTWTTLHGAAWLLMHDPTMRIIIFCADHTRAEELGRACRKLCEATGHISGVPIGPMRGENTIVDWKNEQGGGVVVMSADQSKLGRDVDVLICDDPITEKTYQDHKVCESVDQAIAGYTARAGRAGRRGSVLVLMSRWSDEDPIGKRLSRKAIRWNYVHHSAIVNLGSAGEVAFAEDVMPLEEIKLRRKELAEVDPSERYFFAQFMGDPKGPPDGRIGEPFRYQELPEWPGFRYGMGVDLAYTPGEGDWFACVVCKFYGSIAYVVEVIRERADFNVLENIIRTQWTRYGRCPIFSYIAGPEKGAIRYFVDRGIPIEGMPARYNKATRAQKTIDRINAGKIQFPMFHPHWVGPVLQRLKGFTGSDKARDDDEMDALVSVCDGMMGSDASRGPRVYGKPRV